MSSDRIHLCNCSRLDHALRIEHHDGMVYVTIVLDRDLSIWRRIATAWRHVLGRTCAFGACAEIVLGPEEAREVAEELVKES
jgi:hypothetical protein